MASVSLENWLVFLEANRSTVMCCCFARHKSTLSCKFNQNSAVVPNVSAKTKADSGVIARFP
jgi:hypothetical protein